MWWFVMAKAVAAPSPGQTTEDAAPPKRRRLTAQARKSSILAAARRALTGLYRQLTSTLQEILPLLGLVLFGDPQVAKRFYRENFAVAMDRLAEAWREVEDRYGFSFESPDISARAVMGMALILALEAHHGDKFDRDRAVSLISEGTVKGFFPALQSARRRR
jgi:hypothetical protein